MGKEKSQGGIRKVKGVNPDAVDTVESKTKESKATVAKPATKAVKAPASKGKAGQYIGISLVMLAFVLAAVVASITGGDCMPENLIMTIVVGVCVVLAAVGFLTISIVAGALVTVAFVAYKIYSMITGGDVSVVSFAWVLLPAMAIAGIALFISNNSDLALENALLKKQIAGLVMMDPVTGLYNLRSMFMDIQTQISYSERNKIPFTLMIIRLRYPRELKKVLKKEEYEKLLKQLSLLLVDTVRLEDKVYSIDDNGGFGIILTCDKEGTKIVEKRLRSKLKEPKWFSEVSSKHEVRAELKVGYLQYEKESFNRDANAFKEKVEEEVQYDIDNYEYDIEVTDFDV